MKNTQAILAAVVLTVLPIAAYLSELQHPPTPFFILSGLLMVRRLKVRSGVGLVSATWASPKRAATLLTAATTTC